MTIENVILTTENCRYCLMCRHITPIERVTYSETLSPHGWALLIASERRGLIEWNEDTVNAIYSAPDGGNSRAHCVTSQPLPAAIAAARAQIVERGLAPQVVYNLHDALKAHSTPFATSSPKAVDEQGEDALYVGDEAAYLWPAALTAAAELLKAVGVNPVPVGAGRSSGYFASSIGVPETAAALANANLEDIRQAGAARVIVLNPGDYFTFKQLWDERLGVEWPQDLALTELVTLLTDKLETGEIAFNRADDSRVYAYVDPTHAVRVAERHDRPRKLVEAVMPGQRVELYWRRERAHPVGSTALQFTQPAIAEKLTRARLEDARTSGAQVIVTEDPATLYHLSQYADEYGLEVVGLYELLAEHLK